MGGNTQGCKAAQRSSPPPPGSCGQNTRWNPGPCSDSALEQALAYGNEASQIMYLNWLGPCSQLEEFGGDGEVVAHQRTPSSSDGNSQEARGASLGRVRSGLHVGNGDAFQRSDRRIVRRGPWAQLTLVTSSETADLKSTKIVISRFVPPLTHIISYRRGINELIVPFSRVQFCRLWCLENWESLALREVDRISQGNVAQALRNDRACRSLSPR